MSNDRKRQADQTDDAILAPFFAAASEAREAPLDDALARRLTDQALAAMPMPDAAEDARAKAKANAKKATARTRRWQGAAPGRGWLDWLLAPPGLAGAAAVAGVAGLAFGLWVPEMGALAGGALGWTGLPLAEPDMPWAGDAGLLALIDG